MKIHLVILGSLSLFLTVASLPAETPATALNEALRLEVSSVEEWDQEVSRVVEERSRQIDAFLGAFAEASDPAIKARICYVLGILRDQRAVPDLVREIELRDVQETGAGSGRLRRWGTYPARDALVAIGLAAVNGAVTQLEVEPDEDRAQLLASVIRRVMGEDLSVQLLRTRLEQVAGAAGRERLLTAVEYVKRPSVGSGL